MDKYDEMWKLIKNAKKEDRQKMINMLSEEDVIQLRYRTNPYRKPIYKPSKRFLEYSFINMPREYERNLMMTTMVGFIYKMACEYIPPDDFQHVDEEQGEFALKLNAAYKKLFADYKEEFYAAKKDNSPEDYVRWLRVTNQDAKGYCKEHGVNYDAAYPMDQNPPEERYEAARLKVKEELGIKMTKQDKIKKRQDQILDFLDYHFKFDPNNHIRCNYYPNYDKILQEKIKSGNFKYNDRGMIITENYEEYLVPPVDTFAHFKSYFETNYEHLRQCTDDIYGRSEFENAAIAREVFDDHEKANEWENTYRSDFDVGIHRLEFGAWTFIDPWKENRESLRLDDEKDRLVKEMLEKKKEDERVGRELMKKRSKKMQNKATKEGLPFENQMSDYKTENLGELEMQTNIYQTKLVRSRRMKFGRYETATVALEK